MQVALCGSIAAHNVWEDEVPVILVLVYELPNHFVECPVKSFTRGVGGRLVSRGPQLVYV